MEDGSFHHICFTWGSSIGVYQLYKDGKQVARGMGLKRATRFNLEVLWYSDKIKTGLQEILIHKKLLLAS